MQEDRIEQVMNFDCWPNLNQAILAPSYTPFRAFLLPELPSERLTEYSLLAHYRQTEESEAEQDMRDIPWNEKHCGGRDSEYPQLRHNL